MTVKLTDKEYKDNLKAWNNRTVESLATLEKLRVARDLLIELSTPIDEGRFLKCKLCNGAKHKSSKREMVHMLCYVPKIKKVLRKTK